VIAFAPDLFCNLQEVLLSPIDRLHGIGRWNLKGREHEISTSKRSIHGVGFDILVVFLRLQPLFQALTCF
jgi:hypothetical protein